MTKNKFYITTAIDYTNDVIHIGHSYQKIVADCLARYHRLIGDKTFFLTGTDEHGQKVEKAADEAGESAKDFVDKIAAKNKEQMAALNIAYDRFIRTTDADHYKIVKDFYLRVKRQGDIYWGDFKGLYCEGCESYVSKPDLIDGQCQFHPTKKILTITEKNYFFAWSKYQKFLEKHLQEHPEFIRPESKREEMISFLNKGLEDIPISRTTIKWGIPVPNDPNHRIYVWFDALINYITGAPNFWPADVHLIGKDNLRWHALLWPAMLKSAGYELPKTIYAHGFINLDGQKISKSLGNIIRPADLVRQFGVDGVRYFFLRYGPLVEDVDISLDKIRQVYNADLANGLGNLFSRTTAVAKRYFASRVPSVSISQNRESGSELFSKLKETKEKYQQSMDNLKLNQAIGFVWQFISQCDRYIDKEEPWQLGKRGQLDKLGQVLYHLLEALHQISWLIYPFLPQTAQKIGRRLGISKLTVKEPNLADSKNLIKPGEKIISVAPLFPRL